MHLARLWTVLRLDRAGGGGVTEVPTYFEGHPNYACKVKEKMEIPQK